MKRVITIITLGFALILLAACGAKSGDGDPDIIVKSSEGDITKEAFYERLKELPGADKLLQEMVNDMILESKFEVTEADIDQEIADLKAEVEKDGTVFQDVLDSQNLSDEGLRETVRISLLQQALVTDGAVFTDEDIETYYESMKKQIDISHILVDEEDEAKDIKEKLDNGEDFAKLAKEFSTDTSAEKGGNLGFISVGTLAGPEFEKVAFKLDVDEISEIVKSDWGYHIITVHEIKESDEDLGTLEENRSLIKNKLIEQETDPAQVKDRIDNLYVNAKVEVFIDPFKDLFKSEEETEEDEEDEDEDEDDEEKDE